MPDLNTTSVTEIAPGLTEHRNLAEIPFVLGGQTFPVPPKGMTVTQKIKVDEIDIPKKSGKVRQPTGFENAEISVTLEVCNEESFFGGILVSADDRVRLLQRLFRESKEALPKPHDIVSPLTELIGVRQVLIMNLEVGHPSDFDYYPVTISMTEYHSIPVQLENAAAQVDAQNSAADESQEHLDGNQELDANLSYVTDQFDAGMAAGSGVTPPNIDASAVPEVN